MPPRSSRFLRRALAFNLVFSTLCGLAILFAGPMATGAALGPFPGWFMAALGVGLLGFAVLIAPALWRLRIAMALLISAMDAFWVISTLPLVVLLGFLSVTDQAVVGCVAVIVALACLLRLRGIRRLLQDSDGAPGTMSR